MITIHEVGDPQAMSIYLVLLYAKIDFILKSISLSRKITLITIHEVGDPQAMTLDEDLVKLSSRLLFLCYIIKQQQQQQNCF